MKSQNFSFNVSDWKALLRRANSLEEGFLTQLHLSKLINPETFPNY
jgi:hypothetical protein